MRVIFLVILVTLIGCNPVTEVPKEYSSKGKIHGELNKRLSPCRLKAVEKSTDLEDHWVCVYDHPKSEIDDRVTICYECKCPKTVYCDLR
tara:strand:- start:165 stop:434 length:270 start_codon:yes stop_codon:yes gene_type:complete